ncbi:MAG: DUF2760 domain-containing protein [Burkholderiaceae bacterium]|nr:DUF2760 domain-containing protein [Burkholderiaceae bacterium]
MTRQPPSLLSRIALAVSSFFSIIASPEFASRVEQLREGELPVTPVTPVAAPAASAVQHPSEAPALQLLGLLQREARFIDFIEEDVALYGDADIGAAARVVHEGCRKVLREHFSLEPVRSESEGSRITLAAGFDATQVRVTGNVVGQPPFVGSLSHRGWRVTDTRLPHQSDSHNHAIVAQAEVEL